MKKNSIGVLKNEDKSFLAKAKKDLKQSLELIVICVLYTFFSKILNNFDGLISSIIRIFLAWNILILAMISIKCFFTAIANFRKHRTSKVLIRETK